METQLYNQDHVAEHLGVAVRTLERWRTTGEGPQFVKVGRQVRYRGEDVKLWLAERARRSTSDVAD